MATVTREQLAEWRKALDAWMARRLNGSVVRVPVPVPSELLKAPPRDAGMWSKAVAFPAELGALVLAAEEAMPTLLDIAEAARWRKVEEELPVPAPGCDSVAVEAWIRWEKGLESSESRLYDARRKSWGWGTEGEVITHWRPALEPPNLTAE